MYIYTVYIYTLGKNSGQFQVIRERHNYSKSVKFDLYRTSIGKQTQLRNNENLK